LELRKGAEKQISNDFLLMLKGELELKLT